MQIIKMKFSSSGETYMVSLENGETIKMETETVVKFHLKDEITFTDEEWDEIMSHNSYVATAVGRLTF
jgi:hypothetical protein